MFRILSIDGGGIKGTFPAAFLTALQDNLELPITEYFDLIAGTSTGGIIALGLGLGLNPSKLSEFYQTYGPSIFPSSQSLFSRARHYFKPKYSAEPLKEALEIAFAERLLGDSTKRLLIPAISALDGKARVYKTAHHPRFEVDWQCRAVDVALATSAAPTYFPAHVNTTYVSHLDGGMWANNPTSCAVAEAIGVLNVERTHVRVLSLGCTSIPQSFLLKAGKWGWREKALEAAFSGQSFGSLGIAAMLIGQQNIRRVDPVVEPGRFSLDNPNLVNELIGRANECAREELPKFREMFAHGPAEQFVPFHGPRATAPEAAVCQGTASVVP